MTAKSTSPRFYSAFALALLVGISNAIGQALTHNADSKTDSFSLLNGQLKIAFKSRTFSAIKPKQLRPIFAGSLDTVKILSMNGFRIGEGATLRFYQTSINRPIEKDGGISTWKQIALLTDQVPESSSWLESGWKAMGKDYLYFVKLISGQKPEQYFEFAFFYIDNKLSFSVLQCPLKSSQNYKRSAEESYVSFISN